MSIGFAIPGRVGGKGRQRSVLIKPKDKNKPSFISHYTPEKTRSDEALVRSFGMAAMAGRKPLEGPLWLSIEIRLIPPASWSKAKRASAVHVTGKPDLDNVLKLIGDALNGVCWIDDSQISALSIGRFYSVNEAEQVAVLFGILQAERSEAPGWRAQTLPLFEDGGARIGGVAQ